VTGALALGTSALAQGSVRSSAGDRPLVQRLVEAGVPSQPLQLALRAYACGRALGEFETPILTLVDYARPSSERRLWVLDLAAGAVRFHELVAHGRESGLGRAQRFSNTLGSRQSSLGLFRTAEPYQGRHGYSLRLVGLEPGTNDRAEERGIVVHAAAYATAEFANRYGRLGRSWGCPALDPAVNDDVIDTIRGGTALFAYFPDTAWSESSPYLHCEAPVVASHSPPRPIPATPGGPADRLSLRGGILAGVLATAP